MGCKCHEGKQVHSCCLLLCLQYLNSPGYVLGNQVIELKTSWSSLHPLAIVCYPLIQSLPFCKMLNSPSLECVTIGPTSAFAAKAKTHLSCLISKESQISRWPSGLTFTYEGNSSLKRSSRASPRELPLHGMFQIGQCLHPSGVQT